MQKRNNIGQIKLKTIPQPIVQDEISETQSLDESEIIETEYQQQTQVPEVKQSVSKQQLKEQRIKNLQKSCLKRKQVQFEEKKTSESVQPQPVQQGVTKLIKKSDPKQTQLKQQVVGVVESGKQVSVNHESRKQQQQQQNIQSHQQQSSSSEQQSQSDSGNSVRGGQQPTPSVDQNKKIYSTIKSRWTKDCKLVSVSLPTKIGPNSPIKNRTYQICFRYKDEQGKLHDATVRFGSINGKDFLESRSLVDKKRNETKYAGLTNLLDPNYWRYWLCNTEETITQAYCSYIIRHQIL